MTTTLYDRIGIGYDQRRRADPTIVELLRAAIGSRSRVLDVGCGTGNYTIALAELGLDIEGVDPSTEMLTAAKAKLPDLSWTRAEASDLPFDDATFDALVAVNVVHHFRDDRPYAEMRRVLKDSGRLVIFGSMAEQIRSFWLAHYFPEAIERSAEEAISFSKLQALSRDAGLGIVDIVGWEQHADPVDCFLYCGKHRPEMYLDSAIRSGISTFTKLIDPQELATGLDRLTRDIAAGKIFPPTTHSEELPGDYAVIALERL